MQITNLTTRYLRYDLWANERLTSWLRTVDQTLLYREISSSFGSIDKTLQHIVSAQQFWYSILVDGHIPEFDQAFREQELDDTLIALVANSERLLNKLSQSTEEHLLEPIQASDSRQSRYEYILHVVNHSSYHRGQVVTLSRALGITGEIPVNDYDAYLWWIENSSEPEV